MDVFTLNTSLFSWLMCQLFNFPLLLYVALLGGFVVFDAEFYYFFKFVHLLGVGEPACIHQEFKIT